MAGGDPGRPAPAGPSRDPSPSPAKPSPSPTEHSLDARGATPPLDLIVGADGALIAAAPALLALLGWTCSDPPALAAHLLECAPAELAAPLARALDGASRADAGGGESAEMGRSSGTFRVESCASRAGGARRIRLETGGEHRLPDPIALWGENLAHQIRNQETALWTALHALEGGSVGAVTAEGRAEALRLGRAALQRSSALIMAFARLADTEGGDERADAAELLRWVEMLLDPRLRRMEVGLGVERAAVAGIVVDRRASARAVASLVAGALYLARPGLRLALVASSESAGVRLELRLEGLLPDELRHHGDGLAVRLRLLAGTDPAAGSSGGGLPSLSAGRDRAEPRSPPGGTTPSGGWVLLPRWAPGAFTPPAGGPSPRRRGAP